MITPFANATCVSRRHALAAASWRRPKDLADAPLIALGPHLSEQLAVRSPGDPLGKFLHGCHHVILPTSQVGLLVESPLIPKPHYPSHKRSIRRFD
jgi:hypothetical protein